MSWGAAPVDVWGRTNALTVAEPPPASVGLQIDPCEGRAQTVCDGHLSGGEWSRSDTRQSRMARASARLVFSRSILVARSTSAVHAASRPIAPCALTDHPEERTTLARINSPTTGPGLERGVHVTTRDIADRFEAALLRTVPGGSPAAARSYHDTD